LDIEFVAAVFTPPAIAVAADFAVAVDFVNRAAARFSLRSRSAGSKSTGRLLFRRAWLTSQSQ
jgi:hypothetical protein